MSPYLQSIKIIDMNLTICRFLIVSTISVVFFCDNYYAQAVRQNPSANICNSASPINGLYRIDTESSDKLYSIIEEATSKVPFGEQQQFFIDLAVRLTPPDLLAIECRGTRVSLGSSRAARVDFPADGATRRVRTADNQFVSSRIQFSRGNLIFTSSGKDDGNLSFTFTPMENGKRLRVTRRISEAELSSPVVIRTIYDKIADVARWDIYGESRGERQIAGRRNNSNVSPDIPGARSARTPDTDVDAIRQSLNQWIAATNALDIEKQMSFYMPQLQAFYLARNASKSSVRIEKTRSFASAKSINISAAEPEIIFQDTGRTAIMRFRKKYYIENASRSRRGEVVQELRWRKTNNGWKIFSERDIRVIS